MAACRTAVAIILVTRGSKQAAYISKGAAFVRGRSQSGGPKMQAGSAFCPTFASKHGCDCTPAFALQRTGLANLVTPNLTLTTPTLTLDPASPHQHPAFAECSAPVRLHSKSAGNHKARQSYQGGSVCTSCGQATTDLLQRTSGHVLAPIQMGRAHVRANICSAPLIHMANTRK